VKQHQPDDGLTAAKIATELLPSSLARFCTKDMHKNTTYTWEWLMGVLRTLQVGWGPYENAGTFSGLTFGVCICKTPKFDLGHDLP
jgi:hypothetical protein